MEPPRKGWEYLRGTDWVQSSLEASLHVSSNMSADTSTMYIYIYDVFHGQSTGRWSNALLIFEVKRKCLHLSMRRPDLIELSIAVNILSIYCIKLISTCYTCSWRMWLWTRSRSARRRQR